MTTEIPKINSMEAPKVMPPTPEVVAPVEPTSEALTHEVNTEVQGFKNETQTALDTANNSAGLSVEDEEAVKKETGVEDELKALDAEAENIAKEELAGVAPGGTTVNEVPMESNKQTSEQIREARRMEIVDGLKKEWEKQNGPMEVPLSPKEIEASRQMAEKLGQDKWLTSRMTDQASEFFFDYKGMGKNSIPSQAEKILIEKYPEYAQKPREASAEVPKPPVESNIKSDAPVVSTEDLSKKALDLEQDSTLAQYAGDHETAKKLDDESKAIKEVIGENAKKVEEKEPEPVKAEIKKNENEPYSEEFVDNIRGLYKGEQARLEKLGFSGQDLQTKLAVYKKETLEPMLEAELAKIEAKKAEETKSLEDKPEEDKKVNTESKIEGKVFSRESKENKIRKVSFEEWKNTLPIAHAGRAESYQKLNPTYYIDDKGMHFVVYEDGGEKQADLLYVNKHGRGYINEMDPKTIEKN